MWQAYKLKLNMWVVQGNMFAYKWNPNFLPNDKDIKKTE